MAKWLEKELMRKEKWRPGGDELVAVMEWIKVSLGLCRLRTVPLLALMIDD